MMLYNASFCLNSFQPSSSDNFSPQSQNQSTTHPQSSNAYIHLRSPSFPLPSFSFYFLLANLETRREEILRGTDREGTYDSNPT
ncbi:hypothetical protein Y032_0007g3353 [Ancylostoma ceylanicum]|uniref:Uncharacterized protein n=1 Tax=Ancylostoma ceylanicum TaxID=53326 RepID=A0A016VPK2_9BILA|nr:hypothetical protein Y032_0007g3353 [Ancylostoma ceylanicum]